MKYSNKLGIDFSKEAKNQCEKYNIKYFDTSYNFKSVIDEVCAYLESEL